jgi:hypothetical protein
MGVEDSSAKNGERDGTTLPVSRYGMGPGPCLAPYEWWSHRDEIIGSSASVVCAKTTGRVETGALGRF